MSLIRETLRGMNEMHAEEVESRAARKAAIKKYDENFIRGLFGESADEKKDEVEDERKDESEDEAKQKNESAYAGGLSGDEIVLLIESNRGRPAGARLIDEYGNPILDLVIAEPLQGGALTALSRDPSVLRIHTYRLDIQREIITEINYSNFTTALYSLRDPVTSTG